MNGEVRLSAEGLYSLRARKAKYLRYRYIWLERHVRLNITSLIQVTQKRTEKQQYKTNIRKLVL